METWSPGLNGAGILPGGFVDFNARPEGDGWSITGYRSLINTNADSRNRGYTTKKEVPIWGRATPAPINTVASAPIAPPKAAPPFDLGPSTPAPSPTPPADTAVPETYQPPVQDFKLEEQAIAQRNYLDDRLSERMRRFESLLNSMTF